jgi:serine/threonine protein kinase
VHVLAPHEKVSQHQLSYRTSRAATALSKHPSSKIISPHEIALQHLIDTGNLGGDYRAKCLEADVVVKLFLLDASTSTFTDEVGLWQQLRHPNIIKLYGACEDGNLQLFVCEYASSGSLDEYLKSCKLEQHTPWKFLYQAALGLELLHERKIVHGDLRCRNLLVGSDGFVKVANFGLSGVAGPIASGKSSPMMMASMRWQSPEGLKGEIASFASDVYSLGMCIVEAVTGVAPWGDKNDDRVEFIKRNWRPENFREVDMNEPPGLDSEVLAMVRRMCCQDPGKRMKITSVVYELECLAAKEDTQANGCSPHSSTSTVSTIDTYNNGEVTKR